VFIGLIFPTWIQKVDQVLRRLGDGFCDPERSRLASGTQKNSRLARLLCSYRSRFCSLGITPIWEEHIHRWDYFVSWTGVSTTKNGLGMISMIFGLAAASRLLDLFRDGQESNNKMRVLIVHGTIFAMALYLIQVALHSATFPGVLHSWGRGARVDELAHGGPMAGISTHSAGQPCCSFLMLLSSSFRVRASGVLGRNSTLTGRTDVWTRVVTLVRSPASASRFESF